MIVFCLVPIEKLVANMIQEIYSCIILTSHGQNNNKHRMEVLHENYSSSVIFAFYIGLPKSPRELSNTKTSFLWECCDQTYLYWMGECMDEWVDV